MRVLVFFTLLVVVAQAAVPLPECGQPNEQRVQIIGGDSVGFQGFYATPDTLSAVFSALQQKHVDQNIANSVALGWVELEGSNDAYLFTSFVTVIPSQFRVTEGPSAGPVFTSAGTSVAIQPTRAVISLSADGATFSGWAAVPFPLSADGLIPFANQGNSIVLRLEDLSSSVTFERSILYNAGSAVASGDALNSPALEDLTFGAAFQLVSASLTPKGAFVVRKWRPCPTGCVDANNEACTVYTADDGCASVTAPSGLSTCVSLKFTTSGSSC